MQMKMKIVIHASTAFIGQCSYIHFTLHVDNINLGGKYLCSTGT